MHDRKDYRLEGKPIGKGGQAYVYLSQPIPSAMVCRR